MKKLVEKLWKHIVHIVRQQWKFEQCTPLSLSSKDFLQFYFVLRITLWMIFRQYSLKFQMLAFSCLMYFRVSCDSSSISAKLCNAKLATVIRSRMDEPDICGFASPLCTSLVTFRIHSSFWKMFQKIMHMLCKT